MVNLFQKNEFKDEGPAVARLGKLYTVLYVLSVIGGVAAILASILANKADTAHTEPPNYNKNTPSSLSAEKIDELRADENKRDLQCYCHERSTPDPRQISGTFGAFFTYTLPQYDMCVQTEKYNIERCMSYNNHEEAVADGVICTDGLTKDRIHDLKRGFLGMLDGDATTKFMVYLSGQCSSSKKLARSIVDNALQTPVDDSTPQRLATKPALEEKLKKLITRHYKTVQPLWESQLTSSMSYQAFNTPQRVGRMSADGQTLENNAAHIDGREYFVVSGESALVGNYNGGNKLGFFLGSMGGGGFNLDWLEKKSSIFNADGTPVRGYGYFMKAIIENPANANSVWMPFWRAFYEAGTSGGNFFKAQKNMFLDLRTMLDQNSKLKVSVNDADYSTYFGQCAPTHCTYIKPQTLDVNTLIVAILGSIGGLSSMLKFLFQTLYTTHKGLIRKNKVEALKSSKVESKQWATAVPGR